MAEWEITDEEIETIEKLLLQPGKHFADDAKEVIRFWDSTDVAACPGSGKTTVLLAKLKLIADRMPLENGHLSTELSFSVIFAGRMLSYWIVSCLNIDSIHLPFPFFASKAEKE